MCPPEFRAFLKVITILSAVTLGLLHFLQIPEEYSVWFAPVMGAIGGPWLEYERRKRKREKICLSGKQQGESE